MKATAADVSFVIPAFNEAAVLPRTIASIRHAVDGRVSYEIVVVDNGSTDATVDIAQEMGARAVVEPDLTVAGLRNHGARLTSGNVLVFIDADVVLTNGWADSFGSTLRILHDTPRLLTGSWCGVPDDPTWLEKHWFMPLVHRPNSHINSGHLIVPRDFFLEIGGFDETMETGEDYELSLRAVRAGGRVQENPSLMVVHHGYPRSAGAFIKREAWHGRSDFVSARSIASSKIAIATLIFMALHIMAIAGLALRSPILGGVSVLLIALLCVTASLTRYGPATATAFLATTAIYYLYFVGRTLALVNSMLGRNAFVHRARR